VSVGALPATVAVLAFVCACAVPLCASAQQTGQPAAARAEQSERPPARRKRARGKAASAKKPKRAAAAEAPAPAAPKPEREAAAEAAAASGQGTGAPAADPADVRTEGDTQVKVMEFSGLDIEGQLKTPQMLYFLNRLRAEFGRPKLPHRSFMPELQRGARESSQR